MRNGDVSFWWRHLGREDPREPLAGDVEADVCTVGAGLTGLWTAYYLTEADPGLRIVLCEKRFAGYGASGRNGGWLTGALAGSRERFAATHGRAGVLALQDAMHQTVDEVMAVCAAHGIDADLVKGVNYRSPPRSPSCTGCGLRSPRTVAGIWPTPSCSTRRRWQSGYG